MLPCPTVSRACLAKLFTFVKLDRSTGRTVTAWAARSKSSLEMASLVLRVSRTPMMILKGVVRRRSCFSASKPYEDG